MKVSPYHLAHYIVVTGGVISGLGKGVLTASLAALFSDQYKIVCIKCDGYLNADPGTINPIEHGEVYVLHDGGEVDMDFGHYERLIGIRASRDWNITMGKVYQSILLNERRGLYLGKTVQLIPHATNEIKERIYSIAEREAANLVFIEIGGTIGDIENELFVEAVRQIRSEVKRSHIFFVHLTYVPIVEGSREPKSKPTQTSVKMLNRAGIYPDLIFCRSEEDISDAIREKISLHCNVEEAAIFSNPDVSDINFLPEYFQNQGVSTIIEERCGLQVPGLSAYRKELLGILRRVQGAESECIEPVIAICGKYTKLEDSYASIRAAILHGAVHATKILGITVRPRVNFCNVTDFGEKNKDGTVNINESALRDYFCNFKGAVIVPGGFGQRGMEEKIAIIRYVREHKIPFMGICLGMQLAVIEYARHVCGIIHANAEESRGDANSPLEAVRGTDMDEMPRSFEKIDPVIHLLEEQKYIKLVGGTMRLGGQTIHLQPDSLVHSIYGKVDTIVERFRHRYEVNHAYLTILEKHGLIFSGVAPGKDGIRQVLELREHPCFIGGQFHPELSSTLEHPAPFFLHLLEAAVREAMGDDQQKIKAISSLMAKPAMSTGHPAAS